MRKIIGKVIISLLLFFITMVINTPVAEAANSYSYYDDDNKVVLIFENVSPGEMVSYPLFYRHDVNADIVGFHGEYDRFSKTISLNGSDFDAIKTWYRNFEKIFFSNAEFALKEIPARTFYYGSGAGHGLKIFKTHSVYYDLVGDWAFHYCRNLTEFYSSEVIKTIGIGAFSECTALPNISLKGTEKISDYAFYNNTSLETIETNGALTYIGKYAFYNNNALKSAIHTNVVTLGDYAYAESDLLLNVEFPKLNHIGYGTFQNCSSLKSGYFPVATYVDDYAFYNNSNLTTVTMPRVQTIDPRAFMNNTNLKSLSLPKLRVIKNSAFEGCSNLRTLTLGGTPPTEVGANAFSNLPSDRKIYVPENSRITYDNADGKMDGKWYGWLISPISTECDMLSFTFADFSPKITGLIANTHWVWITVPYGTDVSSLVPTIEISPLATIHPASGIAQDFRGTHSNTQSDLFHYTVRAQSDSDTKPYWIRVSEALGDKKDITNFLLEGNIQGTINEANQMIDFTMPHDTDLSLIIPTITISDGATISPNSGVAQDFIGPVEYTVTALDDSTKTYTVTAHLENNAPTLKSNVTNDLIVSGAVNTPYNLDLSTIFKMLTVIL